MNKEQLAYALEREISNKPPEERREIVESTRAMVDNSYNSLNSYSGPRSALDSKPDRAPALHGLAGDIVRAIDPYTEADHCGTALKSLQNKSLGILWAILTRIGS